MRRIHHTLSIIMIIVFLSGCKSNSVENSPTNIATTYPVETTYEVESAYPSGVIPEDTSYGYQTPGYITATPDPTLSPIIIADVQHEGSAEIIEIKNISDKVVDISAYMIYSPEMEDRKILPENLRLSSGESFMIYNGQNLDYPEEQVWLEKFIINNPLDEILLLNNAARIIYNFIYYPPVSD